MADYQTSMGVILPITANGAARQNTGPLQKASFAKPMEAIEEAAFFGRKEAIMSVATSLFVGKKIRIGTGIVQTQANLEEVRRADERATLYRNVRKLESMNEDDPEMKDAEMKDAEDTTPMSFNDFNPDTENFDNPAYKGIKRLLKIEKRELSLCPKNSVPKIPKIFGPLPSDYREFFIEKILNRDKIEKKVVEAAESDGIKEKMQNPLTVGSEYNNFASIYDFINDPLIDIVSLK